MWLCQFDISVIFFYYASTFPSGNAALNTKRTTGQLIWKCHYKILWNICKPYHQ